MNLQSRIEQYWYGFVVVSDSGVALSKAYETKLEAEAFQLRIEGSVMTPELLRELIANSEVLANRCRAAMHHFRELHYLDTSRARIYARQTRSVRKTLFKARKVLLALENPPDEGKKLDNITGSFV